MDRGRSRPAAEGTPESEAMKWSADELRKIIEADDLHISPFREDGVTPGTPTWIWAVAVDGDLYVRGYNGQSSRWYQAARRKKAGQITAAGATRNVLFEPVAGPINDRRPGLAPRDRSLVTISSLVAWTRRTGRNIAAVLIFPR